MMRIDIGTKVRFQLTKFGKSILQQYLDDQMKNHGVCASSCYQTDKDGFMILPLDNFMRVFGSYADAGKPIYMEFDNWKKYFSYLISEDGIDIPIQILSFGPESSDKKFNG